MYMYIYIYIYIYIYMGVQFFVAYRGVRRGHRDRPSTRARRRGCSRRGARNRRPLRSCTPTPPRSARGKKRKSVPLGHDQTLGRGVPVQGAVRGPLVSRFEATVKKEPCFDNTSLRNAITDSDYQPGA